MTGPARRANLQDLKIDPRYTLSVSYYPAIKHSVEVIYQPIARPRSDLVGRLGDKNQNCPTLVLAEGSPSFENCGIMTRRGDNARDIGRYWAQRYGTAIPRGTGPL